MIHLFAGNDTARKRSAYDRFMISLPEGTDISFVGVRSFSREELEGFISSAGLFSARNAVVLEDLFEREEDADYLLEKLPKMAFSPNVFIFLERKLGKPALDSFREAGAEMNIFEQEKKIEKNGKFNSFVLADALAARNKLLLWINFCQAMEAGVELEPIAGILFWKTKDMLLKKSFGKYSEEELKDLSGKISILLPEARGRGADPEIAFEKFLLEAI